MKKLFFFRSQSNNGSNNQVSPPSTDKQVSWEKPNAKVVKSRTNKNGSEDQVFSGTPCLRRSLSFSSGSLYEKGPRNHGDQSVSPCSTGYYSHNISGRQSSGSHTLTPERRPRSKCIDAALVRNAKSDLSEISSHCSSNVSNKVLDRYIDGEQQTERNESKPIFSMRNQSENGNAVLKRPPRFQSTQPISPYYSRKQKPKSQSFRETKVPQAQPSSLEWSDDVFCNESPRMLAKHVVERLSQSQFLPKMRSKEFDPDNPITIEDVYGKSFHRSSSAYSDEVYQTNCTKDWHSETTDGSHHDEISEFSDRVSFSENKARFGETFDGVTDADMELYKKFKEAENRAAILSEDFEREKFLQVRGLTVPVLIQKIRSLTEEKVNMALEVSHVLQDRVAEKALFKEELKQTMVELDAQTERLEKEKNEMQLALEKQLDRRASEWSLKLEKYQAEEHRLRNRVRELAEQNVSLQKDVSSFSEKETDTRTTIAKSVKQIEDLSSQLEEAKEDNLYMQKSISELQEKCRAAEEERDCFQRNYEDKVTECKDMHQVVSRLQRMCTDQEKTIDGLRGLCGELENKSSNGNSDFALKKLQVEHMRLTGVEHAYRKEVESYRVKVDSLRRENIDLLNRLKISGKDDMFSTFRLDLELQNRISCLQNQVLPMLVDSSKLSRKLLDYVKMSCSPKKGPSSDIVIDAQVIIECEVKLQGLERASDNLTSSIQTISSVLQEKPGMLHEKVYPVGIEDESRKRSNQKSEDNIRSELKAEALLTSLLREKLYSDELEMEQLKAELAAAVRCNDILKCEVQNAMDNFSCVNHKMKDFELQMMKKDERSNRLQDDLQACKKELAVVRGILPKITEERDLMWEEVKQYSEKNMLLDSQIVMLRKKVESLDEDLLVKEGQITILKDSLGKPFDLLASPDTNHFWKESC